MSLAMRGASLVARYRAVVMAVAIVAILGGTYWSLTGASAATNAVSGVNLTWYDSHVRASWSKVADATGGYKATLIRTSDNAIMQQVTVPASQTVVDLQPTFPNVNYKVAVQTINSSGAAGTPVYSATGKDNLIDSSKYNGFLDKDNIAEGNIENNLWDRYIETGFQGPFQGAAFTNAQLHYHLEAGCPSGTYCSGFQDLSILTSRVPFDFTNRTMTVHGEVDLKGDQHQWFGVALAPQPVGDDRELDEVDRFYRPFSMPLVELFSFDGQVHLDYSTNDGSDPRVLATAPAPTNVNNVRDEIVWQVSATHYTVTINGKQVFDGNWPKTLTFTKGYMSLFAEDYPNSGGTNGQPANDIANSGASALWHLDNWGFDAPAGVTQPATTVNLPQGCKLYDGGEGTMQPATHCQTQDVTTNGTTTWTVPVSQTSNVASSYLVIDTKNLATQGALQLRVNGGDWVTPSYVNTDAYAYDHYYIPFNAAQLSSSSKVEARLATNNARGNTIQVSNVEIVTLSKDAFKEPALPAQPQPLGTWTDGSGNNSGGGSGSASAPAISGFTPSHGAVGSSIIIDGANFNDTTAVTINGTKAQFMIHSDGELMVMVPDGATSGSIKITTSDGSVESATNFTVDGSNGAVSINGAACTVTVNGVQQKGMCTGTFTPSK